MGLLHGVSIHTSTSPLYLASGNDYYSDVCLLFFMFHFHICACARIRSLEQNNTCSRAKRGRDIGLGKPVRLEGLVCLCIIVRCYQGCTSQQDIKYQAILGECDEEKVCDEGVDVRLIRTTDAA